MAYSTLILFAVLLTIGQNAFSQNNNNSKYISLSAYDSEESIPSIGSSLLDKLYSEKNEKGVVEYSIPYPYDKFIDRMAGRQASKKRLLSRLQDIKTNDDFISYLNNDMFFLQSSEEQDIEILMPFGRSLQKPRSTENIKNPWLSPRELITPNNNYEPYLKEVGLIKNRIFCGHAEELKSMECISWNSEAGRFEFQIIEDYESGKTPKVYYVNRSKCLSCHQSAAPIFPKLDWLETDDSITLEMALATSHFKKNNPKLVLAEQKEIIDALNIRAKTLAQSRKNNFSSTTARFRSIKAGKFDGAVDASNRLIRINKLWIHLCGNSKNGNNCRKNLVKGYFLAALNGTNNLNKTLNKFFSSKNYTFDQDAFSKVKNSYIFFPFFYDRDPLTSILTMSEIMTCARGSCTPDILEKIISEETTKKLVTSGENLSSFFNPRLLRKSPLTAETKTHEQIMTDTSLNLKLIFSGGTKFKNGFQSQKSDVREIAEALGFENINLNKNITTDTQKSDTNSTLNKILTLIDNADISAFDPTPINREKILAEIWKNLDPKKSSEYLQTIKLETPKKVLLESESKAADFSINPDLNLIYKACAECHSSGRDRFGVPQFLNAESVDGAMANIFYRKDSIIKQLNTKNMPPIYGMYNLTDNEREQIVNFLNTMKLEDIKDE